MNDGFVGEYLMIGLLGGIYDRHVQSFLFKFLRVLSGWISPDLLFLRFLLSYSFLLL